MFIVQVQFRDIQRTQRWLQATNQFVVAMLVLLPRGTALEGRRFPVLFYRAVNLWATGDSSTY